jgi:hypothetical protein
VEGLRAGGTGPEGSAVYLESAVKIRPESPVETQSTVAPSTGVEVAPASGGAPPSEQHPGGASQNRQVESDRVPFDPSHVQLHHLAIGALIATVHLP